MIHMSNKGRDFLFEHYFRTRMSEKPVKMFLRHAFEISNKIVMRYIKLGVEKLKK